MANGIVRRIDELGRITLPIEIRRTFELGEKAPVGMSTTKGVIHLVKADKQYKGIVRELDELGRYTIPIETRRVLKFEQRELVDIYVEGNEICIHRAALQCAMCGSEDESTLHEVNGVLICKNCALAVTDMVMEQGL